MVLATLLSAPLMAPLKTPRATKMPIAMTASPTAYSAIVWPSSCSIGERLDPAGIHAGERRASLHLVERAHESQKLGVRERRPAIDQMFSFAML